MKKVLISTLFSLVFIMILTSSIFAANDIVDFSNATFEFEESAARVVNLKIKGINIPSTDLVSYRLAITMDKNEPVVNDEFNFINIFAAESGAYKSGDVQSYLELNSEKYYIWIYYTDFTKTGNDKYNLIVNGKEINRIKGKQYSDVFHSTFLAYDGTQIILNTPWDDKTERKMQIKIGKIDDLTTLNKIKNNDINGMKDLLNYSKSDSTALYNKKVNASKQTGNSIRNGYTDLIDLGYNNLEDKAYYYLYVILDDENGKYYPVEGVTLAQASKFETERKYWAMQFMGNDNFSWDGLATPTPKEDPDTVNTVDTSISTRTLPYTGTRKIIAFSIVIITVSCVLYIKTEEYKEIK